MIFKITADRTNRDMLGYSPIKARRYYRKIFNNLKVRKTWQPKIDLPILEYYEDRKVVRCDLVRGFKAIAAEKLIASIKSDHLVYCAPRTGHATYAISYLASLYNKHVTFFAPSSKKCTYDQAIGLTYGHDLRFIRIAAMPVLNSYAKKWAEENKAIFLPFGLAKLPEVTAGIVNFCDRMSCCYGRPLEIWCATSTGTMIRGLEIGFGPLTSYNTIAVARNIHSGEIGDVNIRSATVPFLTKAKIQPTFKTTQCYDAKAWETCVNQGSKGAWFMNVGADSDIAHVCKDLDLASIDSFREWGDHRDLERGV